MPTNVNKSKTPEDQVSDLLRLVGQPARIQILFAIGAQETCVCHLEAALGMRQASISQHLMGLRKAGLVSARRDGRYIYYRLTQPAVLQLLHQAARISCVSPEALDRLSARPVPGCACPQCHPGPNTQSSCLSSC